MRATPTEVLESQKRSTPELKLGDFIGHRQGMMACLPHAGFVPKYDFLGGHWSNWQLQVRKL